MLARAAFPAFFFTLAGFIHLLLVTLSVPIIKTIYLLHITLEGSDTLAANAGVFGMCYKGGSAIILGIKYSSAASCTDPKVGYTLDTSYFGDYSGVAKTVIKALAAALILNPIAAGLAGLSLIMAFFAWFCASRVLEILTFITLTVSWAVAWIAFWLDLALALEARHRVNHYTDAVARGHIGNALWIGLAGAICLSLAICLSGCGMFGRYSNTNRTYTSRDVAAAPATVPVGEKVNRRRKFFWQRDPAYRGTY